MNTEQIIVVTRLLLGERVITSDEMLNSLIDNDITSELMQYVISVPNPQQAGILDRYAAYIHPKHLILCNKLLKMEGIK